MTDVFRNSSFSHEELMKITSSVLNDLLQNDLHLRDLPRDVTVDEVNNQIALLHGQSMKIVVVRGEDRLSIVVPAQGSRVSDLKRAINRAVTLQMKRDKRGKRKISWKYVWRAYNLQCEDVTFEDDNMLLSVAGVRHKSEVSFVKRRRKK